jgi:hypothetical protein
MRISINYCACSLQSVSNSKCFFFRGENGPGCFAISACDDDEDCSTFQWLLNTDLKGWIPKGVIESTLTTVQLDYLKHLRKRVDQITQSDLWWTKILACLPFKLKYLTLKYHDFACFSLTSNLVPFLWFVINYLNVIISHFCFYLQIANTLVNLINLTSITHIRYL